MFKRYLNNEKGFSMIEMMVVLIIIAVLIAGGIKFYMGYIENSRVTKAKAQISTMQAALDAYYAEQKHYPVTQSDLLNAGINATDDVTIEAKDPWAASYEYVVGDATGSATDSHDAYVVRTGYAKVQNIDPMYVVGEGAKGGEVLMLNVTADITADGAVTVTP